MLQGARGRERTVITRSLPPETGSNTPTRSQAVLESFRRTCVVEFDEINDPLCFSFFLWMAVPIALFVSPPWFFGSFFSSMCSSISDQQTPFCVSVMTLCESAVIPCNWSGSSCARSAFYWWRREIKALDAAFLLLVDTFLLNPLWLFASDNRLSRTWTFDTSRTSLFLLAILANPKGPKDCYRPSGTQRLRLVGFSEVMVERSSQNLNISSTEKRHQRKREPVCATVWQVWGGAACVCGCLVGDVCALDVGRKRKTIYVHSKMASPWQCWSLSLYQTLCPGDPVRM